MGVYNPLLFLASASVKAKLFIIARSIQPYVTEEDKKIAAIFSCIYFPICAIIIYKCLTNPFKKTSTPISELDTDPQKRALVEEFIQSDFTKIVFDKIVKGPAELNANTIVLEEVGVSINHVDCSYITGYSPYSRIPQRKNLCINYFSLGYENLTIQECGAFTKALQLMLGSENYILQGQFNGDHKWIIKKKENTVNNAQELKKTH